MKKDKLAAILLVVMGLVLFSFHTELPPLGYKKVTYDEESSNYKIESYHWYGLKKSEEIYNGSITTVLKVMRNQEKIQRMEVLIALTLIGTLLLLWIKERKLYFYVGLTSTLIFVIFDIFLVQSFSA